MAQGLTEFLPVSSSGHLVLMQEFLGLSEPMVFFDVLLHVGTVVAILVVYRVDLMAIISETYSALTGRNRNGKSLPNARLALMIVIATIPAGLLGLLFESYFEKLFGSPLAVGVMLLITGAILFSSRNVSESGEKGKEITVKQALIIGFAQALALAPGISRSGTTIVAALLLGVERETAARFSFLMAIPVILGAVLLKAGSSPIAVEKMTAYAIGPVVSFLVGTVALVWLIKIVRRGKLSWFAWYCWAAGLLAILSQLAI